MPTPEPLAARIADYYTQCDRSYQHWGGESAYNLHYGYWAEGVGSHLGALEAMNRAMAERAGIQAGQRVLDAGCGVGGAAIWLARNLGVEVVGVTLTPLQVEKAIRFAEEAGVADRTRFLVADYCATGLLAGSFDAVWGLESVCYAADKEDFLREAARLLRPGGRLVVGDGFEADRVLGRLDRFLLDRWASAWVLPGLARRADFERALARQGFGDIAFCDITPRVRPSAREIFKRGALGLAAYHLKGKSAVQRGHVWGCVWQYPALARRAWLYGIFSAIRAGDPR
jgi:cyclopropane fatty-acyl-phospholipid synthase-like methyltransferase